MPMPQHCIDCDKVAVVLHDDTPYCVHCYTKETEKVSKNDIQGRGPFEKGLR